VGLVSITSKGIDVEIPRDQLVVLTGLSGSGKSSLAFDTIYAEGQRRYVESLSAYARQFLEQMEKPEVDSIEGLSPAHLHRAEDDVQEPALHRGDRDRDLRLPARALCARRHPALPELRQGDLRADRAADGGPDPHAAGRTRLLVLAPVVRGRKGEYKKLFFASSARATRACASTAPCASSARPSAEVTGSPDDAVRRVSGRFEESASLAPRCRDDEAGPMTTSMGAALLDRGRCPRRARARRR